MSRWSEKLLQCSPSFSLLATHSPLEKKKKKGYASDRLEPNRGGIQIGCQVDLTARGAAKDQEAEFRSVSAPALSLSVFCLDDIEFK